MFSLLFGCWNALHLNLKNLQFAGCSISNLHSKVEVGENMFPGVVQHAKQIVTRKYRLFDFIIVYRR